MTRRLTILLVAAIAGGALVTGCGSSSSSSSNSTSTPTATSGGTSTAGGGSTTSSGGAASGGAAATAAGQAAVAACKSSIQAQPTLSASVKTKLSNICQDAASGDVAKAKAATQQVCEEIVKASGVPASAQSTALAACKTK